MLELCRVYDCACTCVRESRQGCLGSVWRAAARVCKCRGVSMERETEESVGECMRKKRQSRKHLVETAISIMRRHFHLLVALLCTEAHALRFPTVVASRRSAIIGALPILAAPLAAQADEVLHIVDYPKKGSCGEALIPDKGVPFVKAFGGFSSGDCASVGYTEKEGEENGTGEKDKERTYTIYGR